MAQQEEGWPMGLQPLNVRVGLVRNRGFSRSTSFHTIFSDSPTFTTDSSSHLDTESTGSFICDKRTTLGSLMGVPRIVHITRRSEAVAEKKRYRSKTWCFSLCPMDCTDANCKDNKAPSLAHFLARERGASNDQRRKHSHFVYGPEVLALAQPQRQPNPLSDQIGGDGTEDGPW